MTPAEMRSRRQAHSLAARTAGGTGEVGCDMGRAYEVSSPFPGIGVRSCRRFQQEIALVLKFRSHHGAVAQLVARLVRNEKVRGSNPLSSTTGKPRLTCTNTVQQAGFRHCHSLFPRLRAPLVPPALRFSLSRPAVSAPVPRK